MDKKLQITQRVTLNNGVEMPMLGLGIFEIKNGFDSNKAINSALEAGYRLIDTAAMYQNERGVSEAIALSQHARGKIFVTSKLLNSDHGYDKARKGFDHTMRLLGFEYLDLYLIHWPVPGQLKETWKALEDIYKEGRVRAIGVSNFKEHHLEEIMEGAEFIPVINQVEFHPRLVQNSLLEYCEAKDIKLQAWSPLMKGEVIDIPELQALAEKYAKTVPQIVIRWILQKGVLTIPKSAKPQRIRENADVFDFTLSAEDMKQIDGLNRDQRIGTDPDEISSV